MVALTIAPQSGQTYFLELLLLAAFPAFAFDVNAAAAILIDANSGHIIYEQNAHESLAPASTTKVLTALVTLEEVEDLSQKVTLPEDFQNVGESGIYLEAGETHSIEDLLYALMLRSANDAGQALGIGVAGSEEAFVELMNSRTEELGLKEGKDFFLIKDNCLTELEPEEIGEDGIGRTLTCIGFRPLPDETAHAISRKYQLYK